MEIVRSLVAPVTPAELFVHVGDLAAYPTWMPLIHDVTPVASTTADEPPAWWVELRAKVGPFARSKRLRMERTDHVEDRLAVFERRESDDRQHSSWTLRAELVELAGGLAEPTIGDGPAGASTRLTMTMTYGGSLWSGPVLERVLDDQVRRGSDALLALVA